MASGSYLTGLRNIEELSVIRSQFNDVGLADFVFPHLTRLVIDGNKVQGHGLVHLQRLPKRKTLIVYEGISEEAEKTAQAALPGVAIDTDDSWKYAP